ncbi:MAG: transposase [Candidatus Rokubacteria bacterium]|nr:transposase [Candidatus Rokubacteria bacterium]
MARPLRLQFPGALYHVTSRGNGRQPVFADDTDHERLLAVLASVVARYHVLCHAYCLMGNHYHLLLETPEGNLSRAMRQLNGVYSQGFPRRHRRPGHVLEGRFHAQVVDKDVYLRAVCRYIVLNPVRAGLVAHPADWRWSSYRSTAGSAAVPAFLTVDWVLALGDTAARAEAEGRYREFVEAGLGETAMPLEGVEGFHGGLEVGDATVQAHLCDMVRGAATLTEIPRQQRFALRPPLAAVFAGVDSKHDRDARCVRAVHDHGYTMKAVAAFLGVHYVTVSRALSRGEAPSTTSAVLDCKT